MSNNRRKFLAGAGAAVASAALPAAWRLARADSAHPARKLVIVFMGGGWDPTYVLDPKPGVATIDAPPGKEKFYGNLRIFSDPSRPNASAFFDKHAASTAIVNGVQVRSIVHPDCWKRILTGTASDQSPDMGAIAGYELARDLPVPYLVLGNTAYTGPLASVAARVGATKQIVALMSAKNRLGNPELLAPIVDPTAEQERLIEDYLRAGAERARAVRGQLGYNRARVDDFARSIERGDTLRGYAGSFGERDLTFDLVKQVELAVDGLKSGLCHAVQIERYQWDTHSNNAQQSAYWEELFAGLDKLVTLLGTTAAAKSGKKLIDETVVAVISEMGRTPKLNADKGKDHWPVTSALVVGAGVAGGRVLGASDDGMQAKSVNLATGKEDPAGAQLQYGNLVAAILQLVGVAPAAYLTGVEPFGALAS